MVRLSQYMLREAKSLYPRGDSYLGPVWIKGVMGDGKFTPWTDGDKREGG